MTTNDELDRALGGDYGESPIRFARDADEVLGRIYVVGRTEFPWEYAKPQPNGCWEWQRAIGGPGYGSVRLSGRQVSAHRAAWEATNGPIPEGLFVCHHCDNRRCINPDHLFLGTVRDNALDMIAKGRGGGAIKGSSWTTHCRNGHERTNENTQWFYNRKAGKLTRYCAICIRANSARGIKRRSAQRAMRRAVTA